ncbi:TRAP transporter large permease subunit [Halomonas sp. MCCC 1A11036]|uniref:TRAP transporter large permease protein n=1 Tax=Billgrantia zhangzhouensis TaxID=2733481 RepID=A0ABS9AJN5_9GAMM|nr:TRAP transporter large permease subunit [Halomonas zhangzhouensis]MCE8021962.1 TRAP transporter large permease subunit [Halomonas zhangzhouensis]
MDIFVGIGLLLLLIVVGIPVGFALGLAGAISLIMITNPNTLAGLLGQVVHHTASNYVLLTIPMFVLMAEFLGASGIAKDLMISCNRLLRKVKGGLAMACVLAGSILAAASGSSTASVASISSAAFPTMKALGYDEGFSIGTMAIAGTLAIMIPPSIAFIVYGIITEESIGRLFMAGLVPGILTALGYIVTIAIAVRLWPHLAPDPKTLEARDQSAGAELRQSGRVWPVVILVVIVLGALYSGIATPTEVGALGAFGALAISMMLRRMTWGAFTAAVGKTLRTTSMIVTIIFGALLFGYFMAYTHVTTAMIEWISMAGLSPYVVLLLVVALYLVLGMFMDQFAIIVLTVPITYAVMTGLGFDGIWLGIVIVKTAEIGLVSPPLGLNIYIASGSTGVSTKKGFAGVSPFLVVDLLVLALIISFPAMTLFLPNLLG